MDRQPILQDEPIRLSPRPTLNRGWPGLHGNHTGNLTK